MAIYSYSLGTALISLSKVVLDSINLPELARPHLHRFAWFQPDRQSFDLRRREDLYIGKEESLQATQSPIFVMMRSTIGTRLPLHCSGMGKAILAHVSAEDCQALIARLMPLKPYATNTITNVDTLQQEIVRRQQGYAIDDREIDDGTRCVAAPIFDNSKRVIGAMSIAGPAYRLTLDHLHLLSARRSVLRSPLRATRLHPPQLISGINKYGDMTISRPRSDTCLQCLHSPLRTKHTALSSTPSPRRTSGRAR